MASETQWPVYRGVYDRLFLPPTIVIGVGIWGANVCARFFDALQSSLVLTRTRVPPPGSPERLIDCFARVACIRDSDRERLSLGWAEHIETWPEEVESEEAGVFTDVDADLVTASKWQIPKARFEEHAQEFLLRLGRKLPQIMSSVSSEIWQRGCESLALRPVGNINQARQWIVAIGSLCEPDAAVILRQLRPFTVDQVMPGNASRIMNMCLIDCGLPDHPLYPNQLWVQCPGSLTAQLLASVQEYAAQKDVFTFYTSSSRLQRLDTPSVVRQEVAAGVMKAFFESTLLQPRAKESVFLRLLTAPGVSSKASALDRVSSYAETALDLSNLAELIALEILAEWKRLLRGAEIATTEHLAHGIYEYVATGLASPLSQLIATCTRQAVSTGTADEIETLRRSASDEKSRLLARLDGMNKTDATAPIAAPKGSLLDRSLVFLRRAVKARTSSSQTQNAETAESLSRKVDRYDEVLRWLEALGAVCRELVRPESDFNDRTYDHHFELKETGFTTLLIRYRRIPLNTCPSAVRSFIKETSQEVPALLMALLSGMASPDQVALDLKRRLQQLWSAENDRYSDPNRKWSELGLAQWIKSDPSLSRKIAEFAYKQLNPLWCRVPGPGLNRWSGFLTVFDYGANAAEAGTDDTNEAFQELRKQLMMRHAELIPISHFELEWAIGSALESGSVQFEAWPFLYNLAMLWTDYPTDGHGFAEDWDKTQFAAVAQRWRETNPSEARWIEASLETTTHADGD